MKHLRPSNVASEMEPQPSTSPDVDESPVPPGAGVGVHVFVVSAYGAHHAEVFSFLARATRNRGVAEDLLRETYARLANAVRAGRAPLEVRSWLFHVATGLVIGGARRQPAALRRVGRRGPGFPDVPGESSPEAGVVGPEPAAGIDRALAGLSTDARLGLLLSGAGFSGEEIAAAIDRPAAATRTLLCRARARARIRRDLFAEEAR